jgi:hypothetical protein
MTCFKRKHVSATDGEPDAKKFSATEVRFQNGFSMALHRHAMRACPRKMKPFCVDKGGRLGFGKPLTCIESVSVGAREAAAKKAVLES